MGALTGRLGPTRLTATVSFTPGYDQRVSEPDLEWALTALVRLPRPPSRRHQPTGAR